VLGIEKVGVEFCWIWKWSNSQ